MNKLLYLLLVLMGFVVLYGVGRTWKLKPETKYNHTLRAGEIVVVTDKAGSHVWFVLNQKDCYSANVAMSKGDVAYLKAAEDSKLAFAVPAGTFVKVLGETESRVRGEVVDGPSAGKHGWVEFEYLRPRKAGEFR